MQVEWKECAFAFSGWAQQSEVESIWRRQPSSSTPEARVDALVDWRIWVSLGYPADMGVI